MRAPAIAPSAQVLHSWRQPTTRRRQHRSTHVPVGCACRQSLAMEFPGPRLTSQLTPCWPPGRLAAPPMISIARTKANCSILSFCKSERVRPAIKAAAFSAASIVCRTRTRSSTRILQLSRVNHLVAKVARQIAGGAQVDLAASPSVLRVRFPWPRCRATRALQSPVQSKRPSRIAP